jgi:hypothetical protein
VKMRSKRWNGIEDKKCVCCGNYFSKRDGESLYAFERRKLCGPECRHLHSRIISKMSANYGLVQRQIHLMEAMKNVAKG